MGDDMAHFIKELQNDDIYTNKQVISSAIQ